MRYSDSKYPQESDHVMSCTLKNFPYQIEHTIQWARDFFEGIFVQGPNDCNEYLKDPESYINKLENDSNFNIFEATEKAENDAVELIDKLENLDSLSYEIENPSHEGCIRLARAAFQKIYYLRQENHFGVELSVFHKV